MCVGSFAIDVLRFPPSFIRSPKFHSQSLNLFGKCRSVVLFYCSCVCGGLFRLGSRPARGFSCDMIFRDGVEWRGDGELVVGPASCWLARWWVGGFVYKYIHIYIYR